MKFVSIIIPFYKGYSYLKRIREMIELNYNMIKDNWEVELIIVNDCPEIPVLDYEMYEPEINLKLLENECNVGIHQSKINGLMVARGEYILFLDQDDIISDDYLSKQLEKIENADAIVCNGIWRNGEHIYCETNVFRENPTFEMYLESGYPLISLGQILIKKDAIPKEWQTFVMTQNGWDDVYLWVCMMHKGAKVLYNRDILYTHEEDGNNASFNWKRMALSGENFRDIIIKLNFMNDKQEEQFLKMVNTKIKKYHSFEKLVEGWKKSTTKERAEYLQKKGITK